MDFSLIFSSKPFGTCFLIFFLGLLEILVDPKILTYFVNASGKYAFVVRHFDIRYVLPLRNGGSVRPFNTYCWFHDPLARHGIYISQSYPLRMQHKPWNILKNLSGGSIPMVQLQ